MKVAGADACRLVFFMVNAQLPCSLIASYGKSVITATTCSGQAQSTILIYTFRHKTCPRKSTAATISQLSSFEELSPRQRPRLHAG